MVSDLLRTPDPRGDAGSAAAPGGFARRFLRLNYIAVLAVSLLFLREISFSDPWTALYGVAIWLTYGAIYLIPLWFLLRVGVWARVARRGPFARAVFGLLCALLATTTVSLLYSDAVLYQNWGYHVNGFVWNLVKTPGGIESLGAGESTFVAVVVLNLALFALELLLLWLASRAPGPVRVLSKPTWRWIGVLFLLSASERIFYGFGHAFARQPTLAASDAFPLYSRLTFDGLARDMGIDVPRRLSVGSTVSGGLRYPKEPIRVAPDPDGTKSPNIIWLVSESLRADALDPVRMPNTFEFAKKGTRFTQHYSGGNGTRVAIFTMFYGIYGSYWFSVLDRRQGPVIFDVLEDKGYDFLLNTSARFTYPEFDRTVFVDIDKEDMTEWDEGPKWKRDEDQVGALVSFLESRDGAKPFFTFSFFESPHANYSFPPETAIAKPYIEDVNYVTMSLEKDRDGMFNRYINSCHWLDIQLGRIYAALEETGLIDSTIVIVTGDHGEEFMEKGRWGHNSTFVQEQIRVPLVIHVPGRAGGAVVDRMTSHLDLVPTVLPLLGVENDPTDYCQGFDLFGDRERDTILLADWSRICLIADGLKSVLPLKNRVLLGSGLTTIDDATPPDGTTLSADRLGAVLRGLAEFRDRRAGAVSN
ncbi:MAG TPA: DUF3413 domain-containing protein [Planctomycetes bacterium]|nr:DUF3413 domain-containing protein [Planctomycetota bacterium]